jgi:nucleotide-binding universal stress UspA family protein
MTRVTSMKRIRRVLYATDFSTASRRAFTTAVALARSSGARLTTMHALGPVLPAVPEQLIDAVVLDQLEKQTERWSARELTRLADKARAAGVRATTALRRGQPVAQILRTARAERTDLIVVGTHGRHGLARFFLGSVAERLVAMAPCPVVTVRGATARP